jgi:rubrerythrin
MQHVAAVDARHYDMWRRWTMKRWMVIASFLLIAAGALGATKSLAPAVREVLKHAVTSEREAAARYEVFARKADEEGYRGAAALFRAQAKAERTHGERFAALLRSYDVTPPAEDAFSPAAGSTRENLRWAAAAEKAEQDGSYREAIETCNLYDATDIAKIFDQTRDSEVEHGNLCTTAGRDLDSMKDGKTFYVCDKCGYTTDVSLPFCPSCQHKAALSKVE